MTDRRELARGALLVLGSMAALGALAWWVTP